MRRRWLIAAVPLLLFLLLLALPARLLWSVVQPQLPDSAGDQFSLQGISGSWWSGQAASLIWLGQHRGQLHWQLVAPTTLSLKLEHPQQQLQARLALGDVSMNDNSLRLHQVVASMDASALPEVWPEIRLQGQLQAQLQEVTLQHNRQLLLSGDIHWYAARLAGAAALDLGNVVFALQPSQDHTSMQLSNRDSRDIQVQGSGALYVDRYALQLRLRPLTGRNELSQQLAWLGQRQPDGSYDLKLQGGWQ
jgi:hypothetical protein